MINVLMVAAMKYSKTEGISKKICMQASGLSSNGNKCVLLCLGERKIVKINYFNGDMIEEESLEGTELSNEGIGGINSEKKLLCSAISIIESSNFDVMYVRHMLPNFRLLKLLKFARKKKVRIGYEIPTYPYYREQLNVSKNKAKTILKLSIETVFWPFIYYYINILTVIRANSKAHMFRKMKSITNGFSGEFHSFEKKEVKCINMIGVGTIYAYHGYDKIIKSMHKCNCKTKSGMLINFHIVGESEEIEKLKHLVKRLGLEKMVMFHGALYGNELSDIYSKCNLGVGTMALSLRNADIDTAIKNIEYISYGLPVLSSGRVFELKDDRSIYYLQNENEVVDFNDIYNFIFDFYEKTKRENIESILDRYSWKNIMQRVINCLR